MKSALKSLLCLSVIIPALSFGQTSVKIITGAEQTGKYIGMIKGKNIAVVANQTSLVGKTHLVDTLISSGVNVKFIFAPEHGFRYMADAGDPISNGTDPKTGLPIISLYGKQNKPTKENLTGIDAVIYDIQDVGTRFYTYISTLHYVLESCAENKVRCIILDRPNPNGFYFDGNVADTSYRSFVSMDPIPVVHGLTVGEYAMMANGEGWLKNQVKCDVEVIKCLNYTHETYFEVPVKPSPNLPNQNSIYLYPSLCFFEGTVISCGRGTQFPFQAFGSPDLPDRGFSFTPESVPGAMKPQHLGKKCFGTDLRDAMKRAEVPAPNINLEWVISAYKDYPDKDKFFTRYFDVLAAGPILKEQIIRGMTSEEIRNTWKEGLKKYGETREKYLLYK